MQTENGNVTMNEPAPRKVKIKVTGENHPYKGQTIESSCTYSSLEEARDDWDNEGQILGWSE